MTERRFVVLQYNGDIPAMAACAACERKFFTPNTFSQDRFHFGAEDYLLGKFEEHRCSEEPRPTRRPLAKAS